MSAYVTNWTISQGDFSCADSLTEPATPFENVSLEYTEGTSPTIGPTDWDVYFSNLDKINCPLTCKIYEDGACGTTLYTGNEVSLMNVDPFSMQIKDGQVEGFDITVCVRCENDAGANGKDFADLNNFKITLSKEQCGKEVISLVNSQQKLVKSFEQQSGSQNEVIAEYFSNLEALFQSSNPNCPLSKYRIVEKTVTGVI
jgi:hypothetical protein